MRDGTLGELLNNIAYFFAGFGVRDLVYRLRERRQSKEAKLGQESY